MGTVPVNTRTAEPQATGGDKRCYECNAEAATRCAKCFHGVEDQRDSLKTALSQAHAAIREAATMLKRMRDDETYLPTPGIDRWLALPAVVTAVGEGRHP